MPDLSAMPGVAGLRSLTRGDSRVIVAVLDGLVADHPALENENVSVVRGYWIEDEREPQSWSTAHATHIASVILGADGSEAPGFAPRCRDCPPFDLGPRSRSSGHPTFLRASVASAAS